MIKNYSGREFTVPMREEKKMSLLKENKNGGLPLNAETPEILCVKEIKQILREAREAGLKYIRLRDKARSYERRLTDGRAVSYERDGSVRERDCNSMERSLCAVADYQTEAEKAAKALSEPYIKAGKIIYLVRDDKLRDILNRYYLYGHSWKRIAEDMGYSERHIKRLHGNALQKISNNF